MYLVKCLERLCFLTFAKKTNNRKQTPPNKKQSRKKIVLSDTKDLMLYWHLFSWNWVVALLITTMTYFVFPILTKHWCFSKRQIKALSAKREQLSALCGCISMSLNSQSLFNKWVLQRNPKLTSVCIDIYFLETELLHCLSLPWLTLFFQY